MLKPFGIGVLLLLVVILISLFMQDISILVKYSGIIGLILVAMAAILSRGLVSGDRIGAYSYQFSEERKSCFKWAGNLFMVGLPNLIACLIIYLILLS